MISMSVYRLVHLFGIIFLFVVLGGLSYGAAQAARAGHGAGEGAGEGALVASGRAMALHGIALFIVLLGGFGLLARLGIVHGTAWPGWVWAKLGIWLLAGAAVLVPRRKPQWAGRMFVALPLLGGLAAWLAIFKPF